MNRIDRLTAILIHLQSKRVVKAEEISDRFEISLRTVYRDVKALMEAGVPIGSEAGKGYFIVDGYHLPPVMFSQEEASALLLAGKLVEKMTDHSVRKSFESALLKIKSVLNDSEKDHLENLHSYIEVAPRPREETPEFPNHFLTALQRAAVEKQVVAMEYFSSYKDQLTNRTVEPIGLFYYGAAWHLIAWCQLRNDYRDFRIDRIKVLNCTGDSFDNRNLMSLQEYLSTIMKSNIEVERVVVLIEKNLAKYINQQKHHYGFAMEEDHGDKIRMTFLTVSLRAFARWGLIFGKRMQVETPEKLKGMMVELIEELNEHYIGQSAIADLP